MMSHCKAAHFCMERELGWVTRLVTSIDNDTTEHSLFTLLSVCELGNQDDPSPKNLPSRTDRATKVFTVASPITVWDSVVRDVWQHKNLLIAQDIAH